LGSLRAPPDPKPQWGLTSNGRGEGEDLSSKVDRREVRGERRRKGKGNEIPKIKVSGINTDDPQLIPKSSVDPEVISLLGPL